MSQTDQNIIDHTPDALVAVNSANKIEDVNAVMLRMFGYTREEVIGKDVNDLLPEERRERHLGFIRAYREYPAGRQMGMSLDMAARRSDGSVFPIDASLVPSSSVAGLIYVWVRDITQHSARIRDLLKELQSERDSRRDLEAKLREFASKNSDVLSSVSDALRQGVEATRKMTELLHNDILADIQDR